MNDTEQIDMLKRQIAELKQELAGNSEKLEQQLELAAQIHRTLLPQPVRHEQIHVDARYIPIESVGGDYCQVRFYDEDTCYITMCDVTGHGIGPALLATRVSSEVRHCIYRHLSPHEIVSSLNSFICDHFSEANLYLSFIASRIDLKQRKITWCGAGHPSPLVVRNQGGNVEFMESQNPWIGIDKTILYADTEHTLTLEPGDRLIYYTDGITETMDEHREQLGEEGLIQYVRDTQATGLFDVCDSILEMIACFRHGPIIDDKTLIIAELQ